MANEGLWLSGWDDVGLTALGEAQAREAAAVLAEHEIRRCLVSDMARARRTAELALAGRVVPVHVTADLRERGMGELQGASLPEVRADGRSERYLLPWQQGPPGGESHRDLARRALATLRSWDDGTPTLVVAHGTLIKGVVGLLDGLEPEAIPRLPPSPNAAPIVRRVERWPRVG